MKVFNRAKGRAAEDIAANALRKKGYAILARNFSTRFGELDIVAKDGETLVFVEVKSKTGNDFGLPEDMISPGKLRRIYAMAQVYMGEAASACRIDVVAVVLSPTCDVVRLTHYQNVQ